MTKNFIRIKDLCMIGVATAVICILAPITIPVPLSVPMTMQTFAIMLAAIILGAKNGTIATLIYLLLGAIGLPVFSNFSGGWQSLVGPTGGFLLSFPLMAYIIGLGTEYHSTQKWAFPLSLVLGNAINFICGILLYCFVTKSNFLVGFTVCVLPFIPVTILKTALVCTLGLQIKKRIHHSLF